MLPSLGGYLNEGGTLNLPRFQRFMETLSQYELEKFDDIYSGKYAYKIALPARSYWNVGVTFINIKILINFLTISLNLF